LLTVAVLAFGAPTVSAGKLEVKCEYWHKRLGQLDAKTNRIDLDARICNGQPCTISDTEIKWQEEAGRADLRIDRVAGEGLVSYLSDVIGAQQTFSGPRRVTATSLETGQSICDSRRCQPPALARSFLQKNWCRWPYKNGIRGIWNVPSANILHVSYIIHASFIGSLCFIFLHFTSLRTFKEIFI